MGETSKGLIRVDIAYRGNWSLNCDPEKQMVSNYAVMLVCLCITYSVTGINFLFQARILFEDSLIEGLGQRGPYSHTLPLQEQLGDFQCKYS